jgi:hypothetical protein
MTLPTEMLGAAGLAWGAHRALAALASVSSGAMTKQTTAAVINPKIKAKETKLLRPKALLILIPLISPTPRNMYAAYCFSGRPMLKYAELEPLFYSSC